MFAQTIVNEIKKPKNREKLKVLVQSKLAQFGVITYDSINDVARVLTNLENPEAFNTRLASFLQEL